MFQLSAAFSRLPPATQTLDFIYIAGVVMQSDIFFFWENRIPGAIGDSGPLSGTQQWHHSHSEIWTSNLPHRAARKTNGPTGNSCCIPVTACHAFPLSVTPWSAALLGRAQFLPAEKHLNDPSRFTDCTALLCTMSQSYWWSWDLRQERRLTFILFL